MSRETHQGVVVSGVVDWVLDADPAIRWQALRDLVGAPRHVFAAERARVATEGWGARLLALQGEDGQWAGGACFPAGFRWADLPQGQPWTATLPTLQLLRDLGVDPADERGRGADVLRALDHFRDAGELPDPRVGEAVAVLRSKRRPDGTWLLENTHPGKVHFALEDGDGKASRWNTLRALRVLRWHDGSSDRDHQ